MEEFCGILFTLKKRIQSISESDSAYYKYLIFGHYDGFDINLVRKWYDLRPKGLWDRKLQVDLKLPYIDQYTVRALVPKEREDLEKKGFTYSFWESVADRPCTDVKINDEKKYPYITMSVINLSEHYVRSRERLSDLQEGIEKIIIKGAEAVGYPIEELHCGLFPSIGYSDFVILFQTDNLKKASDIIGYIRGSSEEAVGAVVSNCYVVCGVDKRFINDNSLGGMNNAQISVRINLKGGVAPDSFLRIVEEEIDKRLDKNSDLQELEELKKELRQCFFVTFGNADCILLPEQPLERYLKFHSEEGIFNPADEFFHNYIADIRTSVRIQGQMDIQGNNAYGLQSRDLSLREEKFQEFTKRYSTFLQNNDMHIRSSRAMHQIMKSYLNIAQASHGFDVERVIGRAFEFLLNAMDVYISEEASSNVDMDDKKTEAVNALTIFKDYVGTFIADLTRSDRPFIEGNTLSHQSIGSATKLLFAYSNILKKVLLKYDNKDKFHFVVISGGCDKTDSIDLFSFSDVEENINKPIILCIPEMSLYDIQGTLFRMLHECMHFLGNRHRKERSRHVIYALAGEMAWDISETRFDEDWFDKDLKHAVFGLCDEEKKTIEKSLSDKFCSLMQMAEMEIAELIREREEFKTYFSETDEYAFYSDNLKEKMNTDEILICISGMKKADSGAEKQMRECIYDIFLDLEEEWYAFIEKTLTEMYEEHKKKGNDLEATRIKLPLQSFYIKNQEYQLMKLNPDKKDKKLEKFIRHYMETFMGNVFIEEEKEDTTPARTGYSGIIEIALTVMTESYCDCSAIRILNMPAEDFILSFIYELWDIEGAFPLGDDNILRIGADLKIAYGVEGSLGESLTKRIWDKEKKREEQGYQYQHIEDMLSHLDDILERYQRDEYRAMRKEIEKYLELCITGQELYFEELGELYMKCDFNNSEEIYEVVDELISQWMSLSERS